ncbi:sensor histidine kinase [Aureimonas pseudogalii]|uniref:histidine kinase n=1 Tax=Aureimonas pseudogalii TaxID=1744844 RepID=A0A7W6H442_9HYPH|nr:HAMP domain-containing sensor histidine kinase [Aureimonas pseudogalii]MBB3996589.1 signal transduction histidine kinase [Aureimonas pseudogalii]
MLLSAFGPFVAAQVADDAQRRVQAGILAGLVGFSLCAALSTTMAVLAGYGLGVTLGWSVAAFAALAAAVLLAVTGERDLVLASAFTMLAVFLGVLSVSLDSLWPLALLAAGPAEAWLARASLLVRLMMPAVFVAIGLVGYLSLHGIGPAEQGLAGWQIALPALLAYAGFVGWRAVRPAASREVAASAQPLLSLDAQGRVIAGSGPLAAGMRTSDRFSQRLHLLDRVAFLKALDEIRGGAAAIELDLRVERAGSAGATFLPVCADLVPVRDRKGTLLRVDAFDRDETAPGAIAPLLPETPALLATVSHELRTPLNAIIGFSDLLDQETFGPFADPRQKEYVALIRRSSQHLLEVVNGLLDVSKLEAGRYELLPEPFSIAEMADCSAAMIRGEAEGKGLRFVVRSTPAEDVLTADRRACQQILVNLLANAVKFTHHGTVCLAIRSEDGAVLFEVADTGIGIQADDIDRLGRPFVQLSQGLARRYEGTGLGLSLVKGLAELHGGSLRIRSQPGRGTTVTVRIPIDCAERMRAGGNLLENVVALTHARQKDSSLPKDDQGRLSA